MGPRAVVAHPHIFIETGMRLLTDGEGTVTAVEVTWRYDELYSLLLLQDYALDLDFDGVLTDTETAETLGFDLNWSNGFQGGLYLWRGETALDIGPPQAISMTLRPDGRMETVHRRPVNGDRADDEAVRAQMYDDAFYIAFDTVLASGVDDGACAPDVVRADLDAALATLEAEIAALGGAALAESAFPAVGALFADQLVFQCVQ